MTCCTSPRASKMARRCTTRPVPALLSRLSLQGRGGGGGGGGGNAPVCSVRASCAGVRDPPDESPVPPPGCPHLMVGSRGALPSVSYTSDLQGAGRRTPVLVCSGWPGAHRHRANKGGCACAPEPRLSLVLPSRQGDQLSVVEGLACVQQEVGGRHQSRVCERRGPLATTPQKHTHRHRRARLRSPAPS